MYSTCSYSCTGISVRNQETDFILTMLNVRVGIKGECIKSLLAHYDRFYGRGILTTNKTIQVIKDNYFHINNLFLFVFTRENRYSSAKICSTFCNNTALLIDRIIVYPNKQPNIMQKQRKTNIIILYLSLCTVHFIIPYRNRLQIHWISVRFMKWAIYYEALPQCMLLHAQ